MAAGSNFCFLAEGQQRLPVQGVQEALVIPGRDPAQALHVHVAAARQGMAGELLFQALEIDVPVGGQAVDLEILEPHGGLAKSGGLYGDSPRRARRLAGPPILPGLPTSARASTSIPHQFHINSTSIPHQFHTRLPGPERLQ
jgi:hypothetical protein